MPPILRPQVKLVPAEMAETLPAGRMPALLTATGVLSCPVVPLPNWPTPLFPQQAAVPSVFKAHVWFPPAEMAETLPAGRMPALLTATGVLLLLVVPLPNGP